MVEQMQWFSGSSIFLKSAPSAVGCQQSAKNQKLKG